MEIVPTFVSGHQKERERDWFQHIFTPNYKKMEPNIH